MGFICPDDKPVFQQETIQGHAVRATLLCTGIAAAARINHREEYYDTALRLWENMVFKRMHITGGVGAFDDPFTPFTARRPNEKAATGCQRRSTQKGSCIRTICRSLNSGGKTQGKQGARIPERYGAPHYRRDGEVRHILARIHVKKDARGRIIRYYGANQDITEHKKTAKALLESEERYRIAIENLTMGLRRQGRPTCLR